MIFTIKNNEFAILGNVIDDVKNKIDKFNETKFENGLFGKNGAFASLFSDKKVNNILSSEVLSQFDEFKEKFNSSSLSAEALAEQMENVDQRIVNYAKTCKNGEMTTEGFKASINGMSLSAKAGKVALQALATAGNMIVSMAAAWAVSTAVNLAVKAVDNYVNRAKKLRESVKDISSGFQNLKSTFTQNKSKLAELQTAYNKLSEGVDSHGSNISLTTEEYEQYKNVMSQIADIMPEMNMYYDAQGNAVSSLTGKIKDLNKEYEKLQRQKILESFSQKDENGNNIYDVMENAAIANESNPFVKDFKYTVNDYKDVLDSYKSGDIWNGLSKSVSNAIVNSGIIGIFTHSYNLISDAVTAPIDEQVEKLTKDIKNGKYQGDKLGKKQAKLLELQTKQKETYDIWRTYAGAYSMLYDSDSDGYSDFFDLSEQKQGFLYSFLANMTNEFLKQNKFTSEEAVNSFVSNWIDALNDNNSAVSKALNELMRFDLESTNLSPVKIQQSVNQLVENLLMAMKQAGIAVDVSEESIASFKLSWGIDSDSIDNDAWDYQKILDKVNKKYQVSEVRDKIAQDYWDDKGKFHTRYLDVEEETKNHTKEINAINQSLNQYAQENPVAFRLIASYDENFDLLDQYIEEEKNKAKDDTDYVGSYIIKAIRRVYRDAQRLPSNSQIDFFSAFTSLNKILSSLTENASLLSSVNKEIADMGTISADSLAKIAEAFPQDKYPEMTKALYQYQLRLLDEKDLFAQLEKCYAKNSDAYKTNLIEKASTDKDFWNTLYQNSVKIQSALARIYGADYQAFGTVAELKKDLIDSLSDKYTAYMKLVVKGTDGLYTLYNQDELRQQVEDMDEGSSAYANSLYALSESLYHSDNAKNLLSFENELEQYNHAVKAIDDEIQNVFRDQQLDWKDLAESGIGSFVSDTAKSYDLIERAISKLQRKVSELKNVTDDAFASWSDRNKALIEQQNALTAQMEVQQKAYEKFFRGGGSQASPRPIRFLYLLATVN